MKLKVKGEYDMWTSAELKERAKRKQTKRLGSGIWNLNLLKEFGI